MGKQEKQRKQGKTWEKGGKVDVNTEAELARLGAVAEVQGRYAHFMCGLEMTCATSLSHAVQCVNHDDKNLTNKQENCALTCQCSCALC